MSKKIQKYKDTAVQSAVLGASGNDLIILIYQRIIDCLNKGKYEIEKSGYAIETLNSAHDLIQQGLLASLNYERGGEIAQNLAAIYEWSLREVIIARIEKSPHKIQEIIDVLTPLYEAWESLNEKNQFNSGYLASQINHNEDVYSRKIA